MIGGAVTAIGAALLLQAGPAHRGGANRFSHLDELDPWWPDVRAPKFTTPMWIGEEDASAGVEAAVVLSIDDMMESGSYEAFLRPILERLKQVDPAGRAPLTIFTCRVDAADPHLQKFLAEGVSLDVHTFDHPCPLFRGGDLGHAERSYGRSVISLQAIPGNRPVAYRMPCCDSLNTSTPRFYDRLFGRPGFVDDGVTRAIVPLALDSSIAMAFTSDDPELPRELVQDPDGTERFLKYLPVDRRFANYITNYPYPYRIDDRCIQLPWVVPTDWEGHHRHGSQNARTVEDLKAALDLTVLKQGLFTFVFHPYGWCSSAQVVELIDHAVSKHGRKVRFLSLLDVHDRLERVTFGPDLDEDGFVDVAPATGAPAPSSVRYGIVHGDGRAVRLRFGTGGAIEAAETHDGRDWLEEPTLLDELAAGGRRPPLPASGAAATRLRDLDGDGRCELLIAGAAHQAILRWDAEAKGWRRLPFGLPCAGRFAGGAGRDEGVRLLDLDEDGDLDLVVSGVHDAEIAGARAAVRESGIWLFESIERGWSRPVTVVSAPLDVFDALPAAERARFLPLIARPDGSDNGMWVKDRALWWVNEETDRLPAHCERRTFVELLSSAWPVGDEPPPRSPGASLHALHLRPGFAAQLVAAEPLVADPICIEWGADGRLWVVEMGDYPRGADGAGAAGGRVKFLEDLDGDGVSDRATLFLDGLSFPTSVLPWRDGVLVTAAPDLLFAADRDGDGRAEVREVLFTGFRAGNPQHRVNGLRLGLDGWVHGANGDSDGEILSTRTGARVDIAGRDWRCDPDRGLLEPMTGRTQYGRERDDGGNWFGGNNTIPVWHFVLEEEWLRRGEIPDLPEPRVEVPALRGAQPVFPASITRARFNDLHTANHFTSACSPVIYRDDLFGPVHSRSLFVCEPVHNLVHRERIERSGVTFTSRRAADESGSEFLVSSDPWFRPVQARTGPDGALWIVDMCRNVIEHPEWIPEATQALLDLRAGADRGRLWRVFPVDRPPRPFRRLDELSDSELVAVFEEPNGWRRDTAQRLLLERSSTDLIPALQAMWARSPSPVARLHALCTLVLVARREGVDAASRQRFAAALRDPDREVRRWAVRLGDPVLVAGRLGEESDPAVRLELLAAWGNAREFPRESAKRFHDELARLVPGTSIDERMLAAAAWSSLHSPAALAAVGAIAAERPGEGGARLLPRLAALAVRHGAAGFLTQVAWPEPKGATPPEWALATIAAVLESAARGEREAGAGLETAGQVLGEARLRAWIGRARELALDRTIDPSLRARALPLLGFDPVQRHGDVEALADLVAPAEPPELARAAIARAGAIDDPRVAGRLLAAWRTASPDLRAAILDALTRRDARIAALLDALAVRTVAPGELPETLRQRLLQHDDEAVRARAQEVLAARIDPDRAAVVEAFRPALTLAGERTRGQLVFERKCANCHRLRGLGHEVGPDLATMSDQSPEALLIAVLDPNRAVEGRYESYSAVTRGDEVFTGVLADEGSVGITLRDAGGKEQRILRSELKSLRSSSKSLMTEGLEADTTPQDLADLLAFLREDGRPGKRFAGNEPLLVRPMGECGALHLTAATAEIYGPRLVFEAHYGNLGWWQTGEDFAAWMLEPGRAGSYDVRLEFACAASSAGATLVIEAGGRQIAFVVPSTSTWDEYREQTIGTLELGAGVQRLVARAGAPPREAVIDLREIRLTPRAAAQ